MVVRVFKEIPRTMDCDEFGLCFHCGRWCSLHAEIYSLNVTSIMESVMLRSGVLLYYPLVLVNASDHGLL